MTNLSPSHRIIPLYTSGLIMKYKERGKGMCLCYPIAHASLALLSYKIQVKNTLVL